MTINVIQRNGNVNGKNLEHFIKKYWQALCPIPKNSNPAWDNNGGKDGQLLTTMLVKICLC